MKKFLIFLLLLFSVNLQAQEVLFECDFNGAGTFQEQWESAGGTTYENSRARGSIVDGGVNGTNCLKMDISTNVDAGFPVYIGANPITIVYWEKFNKYPIAGGNIKGVRPYYGANGGDYMASTMTCHFDDKFYLSAWREAKLITGENVTAVDQGENYCSSIGPNTYRCDNGRMRLNWNPGFGTEWTKVRLYIKLPSDQETNDGEIKVWFNEKLTLTVTEILGKPDIGPITRSVLFAPSDAAEEAYEHFYDDVTIYGGYVPPEEIETHPAYQQSNKEIILTDNIKQKITNFMEANQIHKVVFETP